MLSPQNILEIFTEKHWPYKGGHIGDIVGREDIREQRRNKFRFRDNALCALLFLTSGRINEVLRLTRDQFIEYSDPDILLIDQFWVSKRKKGKIHPTPDIPLPRVGTFAPFTALVEEYLDLLEPDEILFTFTTSRAWSIVKHKTGLWCHWFRTQSLSYQVNLLRSATAVARQRGIENPRTIMHYYRGEWEQFKEELKK